MAASSELSGKKSLEHPFHDHSLTLRDITENCTVNCHICKQDFHGSVFCCEDCDFVVHESCARIEFPPVIQGHPSHHPDHPVKLVWDELSYCCGDCGFSMGALTAIATLLPPQGVAEDTILHFGHEHHPLSSFRTETVLEVQCGFCEQQISGQVYGCRSCLFLLHEACARLQSLEIQHPLHHCQHPLPLLTVIPEETYASCNACTDSIDSRPGYNCEKCLFTLHLRCAYLTMDARSDQEEEPSACAIKHFSHKHPLTPFRVRELFQSRMECEVCRLNITGGEAFCCTNKSCRFFLHKSCAEEVPEEIEHPLHPQHPRLVLRPKGSFKCGSCMYDGSDVAFSCRDCKFNLHPRCALQTLSAIEEGAVPYVSHFAHEDPLTLAFTCYGDRTCDACNQSIDVAVAYRCTACKFFWLHRSCAERPLELEHPFHPQHPLVLWQTPASHFFCFACHEKHEGLAFYCAECQFYLGVGCTLLSPSLKHPRHQHPLAYFDRNTTKQLQCSCCGKRCRYDFYCCMRCNFSLHSDCLHLPPTLNHKSHPWHPLQLTDKFVYGKPDDQYCDYCETIRNPDHGVYRCEQCDYTAHIECIIYDHKGSRKPPKVFALLLYCRSSPFSCLGYDATLGIGDLGK